VTTQTQLTTKSTASTILRVFAVLTAVGALLQALLGGYQYTALSPGIVQAHVVIGLTTIVVAVIATIAAAFNSRSGGNRGLMFHALGTAVLLLVQYALGEMGINIIVHMVIGVVILISAIALATLAIRKPHAQA
jgi:hypothetical protein